MEKYLNCIGGRWVEPSTGSYDEIRNPANTDEVLALAAASGAEDVQTAIDACEKAQTAWAATPAPQRGRILYKLADLLEQHRDALAEVLTKEEGKTLNEAKGEVGHSAGECRFMASEAFRLEGKVFPSEKAGGMVCHVKEPLGVIAAINPWNFPVVTPIRKIAPALACGDTVVFKPAQSTPGTAVYLMRLFEEAGVPAGVVNLVCGSGRVLGDTLCESPRVKGISFTGSTGVGRHIAQVAGQNMTRLQLEMGGKNPAVVWDPLDMDFCVREIVSSAFGGAGQKCTAISKVIVKRDNYEELLQKLIEKAGAIRIGDGMRPDTDVGPLASKQQYDSVCGYMQLAQQQGKVLLGGQTLTLDTPGYYVQPTIVTDVGPGDRLAMEEVFGPFLSVIVVDDFDAAMRAANAAEYGLTSCIFTGDLALARRFTAEVQSGMTHVNQQTLVMGHVPFGGVKNSGFGAYSNGNTAKDFYMLDKVIYFA